jgi:hypothetical protein
MRRIMMLVTVALVMAAMMVAMAMPAFADKGGDPHEGPPNFGHCHKRLNDGEFTGFGSTHKEVNQALNPTNSNQEGDSAICRD